MGPARFRCPAARYRATTRRQSGRSTTSCSVRVAPCSAVHVYDALWPRRSSLRPRAGLGARSEQSSASARRPRLSGRAHRAVCQRRDQRAPLAGRRGCHGHRSDCPACHATAAATATALAQLGINVRIREVANWAMRFTGTESFDIVDLTSRLPYPTPRASSAPLPPRRNVGMASGGHESERRDARTPQWRCADAAANNLAARLETRDAAMIAYGYPTSERCSRLASVVRSGLKTQRASISLRSCVRWLRDALSTGAGRYVQGVSGPTKLA